MRKLLVLAILILATLPVLSQDGLPKLEIFGGYEYLHLGSNSSGPFITSGQGFNGWTASAAYRLHRYLGVEGDFGGSYGSINGVSDHFYSYTGGPVVAFGVGPIQPFAHALFGGTTFGLGASGVTVSWNGFTAMAGAGVDTKINRLLAVRVMQVDWLYYHFGSKNLYGAEVPSFSASNNVRIASGVVLRF
jgi:hypothetical protein